MPWPLRGLVAAYLNGDINKDAFQLEIRAKKPGQLTQAFGDHTEYGNILHFIAHAVSHPINRRAMTDDIICSAISTIIGAIPPEDRAAFLGMKQEVNNHTLLETPLSTLGAIASLEKPTVTRVLFAHIRDAGNPALTQAMVSSLTEAQRSHISDMLAPPAAPAPSHGKVSNNKKRQAYFEYKKAITAFLTNPSYSQEALATSVYKHIDILVANTRETKGEKGLLRVVPYTVHEIEKRTKTPVDELRILQLMTTVLYAMDVPTGLELLTMPGPNKKSTLHDALALNSPDLTGFLLSHIIKHSKPGPELDRLIRDNTPPEVKESVETYYARYRNAQVWKAVGAGAGEGTATPVIITATIVAGGGAGAPSAPPPVQRPGAAHLVLPAFAPLESPPRGRAGTPTSRSGLAHVAHPATTASLPPSPSPASLPEATPPRGGSGSPAFSSRSTPTGKYWKEGGIDTSIPPVHVWSGGQKDRYGIIEIDKLPSSVPTILIAEGSAPQEVIGDKLAIYTNGLPGGLGRVSLHDLARKGIVFAPDSTTHPSLVAAQAAVAPAPAPSPAVALSDRGAKPVSPPPGLGTQLGQHQSSAHR